MPNSLNSWETHLNETSCNLGVYICIPTVKIWNIPKYEAFEHQPAAVENPTEAYFMKKIT